MICLKYNLRKITYLSPGMSKESHVVRIKSRWSRGRHPKDLVMGESEEFKDFGSGG